MMDKAPLVSVVIPTYNHAGFIKDALESLRAQTFEDWEAIVVNNFSEDDTISVVESFGDSRIRLENFRNHGVIAASRNHAISLAKGEILAFLDSDDIWLPEKLEKCLGVLDENTDLVCHGLRTFGDGPEYIFFGGPESRATFDELLYGDNCLTPTSTIVRKESVVAVGRFSEDVNIITAEDYHLWIKLAKAGARMKFLQEELGLYRIHSMNQSGSVIKNLNAILATLEEFFPRTFERSFLESIKIMRRRSSVHYAAGRAMQKAGKHSESWAFLINALLCWPFYFKLYPSMFINVVVFFKGRR